MQTFLSSWSTENIQWPHPFLINQQTPEAIASIIPALKCQYLVVISEACS